MDLYPLPTTPLSGGVGQVNQVDTTTGHENYLLGRVDYTVSPKTSLFARYVSDTADLFEPFSGSSIPIWSATNKTNNQILTAEHRRLVSSNVITQLRVGLVRTRELADNTGAVPELTFFPGRMNGTVTAGSGISVIGANQLNPFDILQRKYSVADDVYWHRGSHSIKFGGAFERQGNRHQRAVPVGRRVDVHKRPGLPAESARLHRRRPPGTGQRVPRVPRERHRRLRAGRLEGGGEAHVEPRLTVRRRPMPA